MRRRRLKQEAKLNESNDKSLRSLTFNDFSINQNGKQTQTQTDLKYLRNGIELLNASNRNRPSTCNDSLSILELSLSQKSASVSSTSEKISARRKKRGASKKRQAPSASMTLLKNADGPCVNTNGFTKEILYKRIVDSFDTLDKDMHFEFCVSIRSLSGNISSVKIDFGQI